MLRIACGISKPSKHGLGLWVWMILPGDTLAHLQNNRRLPNLCSLFLYEPPTPTRPSPCRGGSFPPVCECGTTPASSHRGCWTGSSRLCRSCATSSSSKRGGGGQAQLGEPCGHGSPWTQTRRKNSKLPRSPLQPIAEGFQVLPPAEKRTIAAEARALVLQTVFGWISRKVVLQSGGVQNALLEFHRCQSQLRTAKGYCNRH